MTSALIAAAIVVVLIGVERRDHRRRHEGTAPESLAAPFSARNWRDVVIVILAVGGLVLGLIGVAAWKSLG